jgi:enoyl-CoA hydratase/carnithine racemase
VSGGLREPLDVRHRANALWLTLNRPAARNGIDAGLVAAIGSALDAAESAEDVAAVVVTAAGPVFCAGADLKLIADLAAMPPQRAAAGLLGFLTAAGELFDRIEAFGKPVIAAVDGLAVAGGLELVLACDIVIATEAARFGDAHANYGLLPGGGGSARLPRRVGESTAKYLMITGRDLPARDLAHTDLVTVLVSPGADLQSVVDACVGDIAAKSPKGIQVMKQLVRSGRDEAPSAARLGELDALARHALSEDFAEGLRAFSEKRRPVFTGR